MLPAVPRGGMVYNLVVRGLVANLVGCIALHRPGVTRALLSHNHTTDARTDVVFRPLGSLHPNNGTTA